MASRPLEALYPFMYVDAMMVKVKQDGKARNKAVYTVIGVDLDGHKDILYRGIDEADRLDKGGHILFFRSFYHRFSMIALFLSSKR